MPMSAAAHLGAAAALRPDGAPDHRTVRLSEYRPPEWLVDEVHLTFRLDPNATRVTARLSIRRNPAAAGAGGPRPDLRLDGRKLTLIAASIDGAALGSEVYALDEEGLTVPAERLPADAFHWVCETEIDPASNTALEGLYLSGGVFCTQCEAQGFRKITFFPDRPDVMAVYTTRIEGLAGREPVMLSNGNPVAAGSLEDGRRFVEWRDPHPKPCYLFALVAGDLSPTSDVFDTASGRRVELKLFTRPGDESKAGYALDALKRAMRWDEEAYGREYDLDLFMIVAVDDFNMGAMENKGLNVFNSRYVLASPETATDHDYELIESVVAHEYFHNWTGNRITCRDWFQLCLKEGLTVFRDQQFSEDQRSAAVQRIDGVKALRARQFREDAGPLAHPVRPESYVEINNFYTATVYEKGAEIVRMLRTLLGPEGYRAALDLYFERHDGQACTVEDFLACFADSSGRDLSAFKRWWTQAGTPRVTVEERFLTEEGVFEVTLSQNTPATPGQEQKEPVVLPLRIGLLSASGAEIPLGGGAGGRIFLLEGPKKTWRFEGLRKGEENRPVLSINRGFSAPVIVERKDQSRARRDAERALLLAHDSDPFARWEAGRGLALDTLLEAAAAVGRGEGVAGAKAEAAALTAAMASALADPALDPAFQALLFALPGEDEIAGETASRGLGPADPDAIHAARDAVREAMAEALRPALLERYEALATPGPFQPTAEDAGKRALRNAALSYLCALRSAESFAFAERQFAEADNMTEQAPALTLLVHHEAPTRESALQRFYDRWSKDSLVLGKWFGVQATSPAPGALGGVAALTAHPAFEWRNPNKFRALIGAFAMGNPVNFHRKNGEGYRFVADWLLRLDAANPQTAAKLASCFETWRRYDAERQALMKEQLDRIAAHPGLSKDMSEIVTRIRGA